MAKNDLSEVLNGVNQLKNFTTTNSENTLSATDFKNNGFVVNGIPSGSSEGLPSSNINYNRPGKSKHHIVHWFIPEIGVVKMAVNPNSIQYNFSKLISENRTKNGYLFQYWGEQLTTLTISGTTGSTGIEGINVLYELYRAEQLGFDPVGLSLAAQNSSNNKAQQLLSGLAGNALGSISQNLGGAANLAIAGASGTNPSSQNLSTRNIPSLATIALGIEMYYMGWVFRGFFKSFNFSESADNYLFNYSLTFTVTQKRGYRVNYFPWHRSATQGHVDPFYKPPHSYDKDSY